MKRFEIALLAILSVAGAELVASNFAESFLGRMNESFTPLVVNGASVRNGNLPYHCTIYIRSGKTWRFVSGTFIAPNLVLTVLAPYARAQEVRVYYGSNQLSNSKMARAKSIIRHDKYDHVTGANNVGILVLSAAIKDGIAKPIDLPPSQCKNSVFDNQNIFAAGFGTTCV